MSKQLLWTVTLILNVIASPALADALTWPGKDLPYDQYLQNRTRTYDHTEWANVLADPNVSKLSEYYLQKAEFSNTPGSEAQVPEFDEFKLGRHDMRDKLILAMDFSEAGKRAAQATALQLQKDLIELQKLHAQPPGNTVQQNHIRQKTQEAMDEIRPKMALYFGQVAAFELAQLRNQQGCIRITDVYAPGQDQRKRCKKIAKANYDPLPAVQNLIAALPSSLTDSLQSAGIDYEEMFEDMAEEWKEEHGESLARKTAVAASRSGGLQVRGKNDGAYEVVGGLLRPITPGPVTKHAVKVEGLNGVERFEPVHRADGNPEVGIHWNGGLPEVERFEPVRSAGAGDGVGIQGRTGLPETERFRPVKPEPGMDLSGIEAMDPDKGQQAADLFFSNLKQLASGGS